MPPTRVYTAGYSGQNPDDLKMLADHLNATVVDIRISVASIRKPEWSQDSLVALLGHWKTMPSGWRYCHIPMWGNKNRFSGGAMELAEARVGLTVFETLPERPAILLCACYFETTCHRSLVADLLRERGYEIAPLPWENAQVRQMEMTI
jgi:hypothetical protein